jgi:exonuclease VII large subunit
MLADDLSNRLVSTVEDRLQNQKENVQTLLKSYALMAVREKVAGSHEQVNNLIERLRHKKEILFINKREQLNNFRHRLEQENPNAPLEKGYVRVEQEEQWVRQASNFKKEEAFEMIWKDGKVGVKGEKI